MSAQTLQDERETKSIHSGITYNQSAIGEMNSTELDQLLVKNEARIEAIKARFFEKKENIKTYQEVLAESKENFETKQRYKDNSLAYPTYGRGLDPHRDMNTFMV